MPLQFAVTLFLSASLLFMVQPMVGKMVLPLLGGSPAVWNACMLFYQAVLLLGYLYAHWLTTRFEPARQWRVHMLVLLGPLAVMGIAAILGARHIPIPIAESLAPTNEESPFLRVMALLTVAIGIPFFVASTSAPLLQRWFADTGHPSARDPYFLYAASNAGSLISLLGYPLITEPNLTIAGQAWLFAGGFVLLAALIFFCGQAAAHPIGTPPPGSGLPQAGENANPYAPAAAVEPPPSRMRIGRWVALGFVPSSLMLGVTFHISTDIVSLPLIWVFPLALYLLTFIIAFSRLPPWFRLVIGNLAPVAILLLIFCILTNLPVVRDADNRLEPGRTMFYQAAMHIAVFFVVALMCHYELARDRPSPKYLTAFFLWISVGGVLGGLFNALVAPMVFTQAYEYNIVLVVACLLVPNLTPESNTPPPEGSPPRGLALAIALGLLAVIGVLAAFKVIEIKPIVVILTALLVLLARGIGVRPTLWDLGVPVLLVVGFWILFQLPEASRFQELRDSVATRLRMGKDTIQVVFVYAIPIMTCFFFVDRPLRFALCVAGILMLNNYLKTDKSIIYTDRSFFGILKVETDLDYQRPYIYRADGRVTEVFGEIDYLRLVHGTTLHGTQITRMRNNGLDYLQLAAPSPWHTAAIAGAVDRYLPRQEPLTYYHRTGPVGAMFHELRTRKGGADAKAPVAMVGLGTGTVSCYALPGQKLTFYEIDPAVRRIVEKPWREVPAVLGDDGKVIKPAVPGPFTYVEAARARGAEIDFRMGDARLKLKQDTDRKYSLLLVDAFSSDAIPVHLITREAIELYRDRMTEDGILALHISNKYVRLEPVCARLAHELGMAVRVWSDSAEQHPGKTASSWVVLARNEQALGSLAGDSLDQVANLVSPADPLVGWVRAERQKSAAAKPPTAPVEFARWVESRREHARLEEFAGENYGTTVKALVALLKQYRSSSTLAELLTEKRTPRAAALKDLLRKYRTPDRSLKDVLAGEATTKPPPELPQLDLFARTMPERITLEESLGKLPVADRAALAPAVRAMIRKYTPDAFLRDVLRQEAQSPRPDPGLTELRAQAQLDPKLTLNAAWVAQGGPTVDLLEELIEKYTPEGQAAGSDKAPSGGTVDIRGALLFEAGRAGLRLGELAELARRYDTDPTLEGLLRLQYGTMFHLLELNPDVQLWTDDYADVMRVMMIPELQQIRRFFGQPTPVLQGER